MKKQQILSIVAAGVTLILLVGSVVVLWSALARTDEVARRRDGKREELERIYQEPVFPNRENVALIGAETTALVEWTSNLVARQRAVIPVESRLTPSQFMQVLQPAIRHLATKRTASGTQIVPEGFAFGFDAYITGGQMPVKEDIPKLALQLKLIHRLYEVLRDANVSSLQRVERFAFEAVASRAEEAPSPLQGRRARLRLPTAAAAAAGAGTGEDPRALDGLHPFTLDFTARKSALLTVINSLAATDLFVVVNQVDVRKAGVDIRPLPEKWATLSQASHPQRVVSGPEVDPPLTVHLLLDVEIF